MRHGNRYIKCACKHITKYFMTTDLIEGNCARCLKPLSEGTFVNAQEYLNQRIPNRTIKKIPRDLTRVPLSKSERKESEQIILNGKE